MTICLLYACDNTPKGVLSKSDMADVLYDYHLTQSMLNYMPQKEREEMSQQYIDAVFEKHGITEEEFDSSLVWYNKNTSKLYDVYKDVQARYEALNKDLQLQTGNNNMMAVFSTGGDTTNIWSAKKLLVLRNGELLNRESFSINADTSFHTGDSFVLMGKLNMVVENKNEHNEYVAMGLNVCYKNGKRIGTTQFYRSNENMQAMLRCSDTASIAKVTGFFYFKGNPNYRSTAFIDQVQLVRMHKHEEPVDTVSADTLATEDDKMLVPQEQKTETLTVRPHLTPDQIRSMKSEKKTIEIKKAPEIRTPNRDFKRKSSPQNRQ